MPPRISLHVEKGKLTGEEFVFDERTTCIVGRADGCGIRVPNDMEHRTISRHHCLLDINPPDICVRDFGSLNGTYVNGERIGRREKGQSAHEAAQQSYRQFELKHGDLIKLGETVLRIGIFVPPVCDECCGEIAEEDLAAAGVRGGGYRCKTCRRMPPRVTAADPLVSQPRRSVCAKCGRDVADEVGSKRQGEYVCEQCQADPLQLMKMLLQMATTGSAELVAIEGYEILRELGRGGMGAVYLARHRESGKQVALKVMLPKVAANSRATERFLRETTNTQALQHPNVVRLWDSGSSRGVFFFTLEFCDGGSVHDVMRCHRGKLPIEPAVTLAIQALDGLAYAHNAEIPNVRLKDGNYRPGRGLVHRDIKPHNIFLTGNGASLTAKIGDYGLAKAFDLAGLSGHTCTGEVAGTPQFMPRQQVLNFVTAGPEVDVWALAASLYYMLTGHFARDFDPEQRDIWQTILQTAAVPIRQRNPKIPPRLAEVLDHALIDDPQIGFGTAGELKQALQQVL